MGSCGKRGLPDTSARIKSRARPFSRRRLLTLQASTPSEPVRIGPRAARSQFGGGPYPVDLIKNELIAESERKNIMSVEDAFKLWNSMLTNLGDTYANQERFLRHYYNAFKADLPPIQMLRSPHVAISSESMSRCSELILRSVLTPWWRRERSMAGSHGCHLGCQGDGRLGGGGSLANLALALRSPELRPAMLEVVRDLVSPTELRAG